MSGATASGGTVVPDEAEFLVTYRNGGGYSTVYLRSFERVDGLLISHDTDDRRHV